MQLKAHALKLKWLPVSTIWKIERWRNLWKTNEKTFPEGNVMFRGKFSHELGEMKENIFTIVKTMTAFLWSRLWTINNKTLWERTLRRRGGWLIVNVEEYWEMIFFQIPFHANTLTFLILGKRRLNVFTGSLLGAWLETNSIIISVINNCARRDLSSTSFISSITTLSWWTVGPTLSPATQL